MEKPSGYQNMVHPKVQNEPKLRDDTHHKSLQSNKNEDGGGEIIARSFY